MTGDQCTEWYSGHRCARPAGHGGEYHTANLAAGGHMDWPVHRDKRTWRVIGDDDHTWDVPA